ncbi:hypothetical protein C8A05DRAFT_32982 [Staphylotrichum tortipilum]|uniref:Uncharacterized protein n=1 Tax=Staphylotrichum tortipilum TaxID=2831512 RepID=A0AAN6RUJ8_9PEZI|nr:hypothetical protein C8A05DRAFT_32982 [Staphylotrichum longicolle]
MPCMEPEPPKINLVHCHQATERSTSGGWCLEITTPEPSTISTCSCFTLLDGFDTGLYLYMDIVHDN